MVAEVEQWSGHCIDYITIYQMEIVVIARLYNDPKHVNSIQSDLQLDNV